MEVGKSLLTNLEKQLNDDKTHMVATVLGRYDGSNMKLALLRSVTNFIVMEKHINIEQRCGCRCRKR